MSTLLDLPTEVFDFLRRPCPQTLLVRGPPGSGKSTFALALLQNFPGHRVYVTTRVSKAELLRDYPYLGNGAEIEVIDGLGFGDDLRERQQLLSRTDQVVEAGERGTAALRALWLPEAIQEAWSRTRPERPSLVVIDSWDALIEAYLGPRAVPDAAVPDRETLERLLIHQMSAGHVFLALLLERAAPGPLDYLVNGVVETAWESSDGRPERWLRLPKLRGTRIDHASYPFSLEGGRFQCILPLPPRYLPPGAGRAEPEPEPDPQALWPGSAAFAKAFGRLPLGSVSIFERDESVPTSAIRLLVTPMVASVTGAGDRVVHILPPNILPKEVWATYRTFLAPDAFARQVRLQTTATGPDPPEEIAASILPPPSAAGDGSTTHTPEALRFLREPGTHRGNLSIVWLSGLHSLALTRGIRYAPETLPTLALDYATGSSVHVAFIGVHGDPLLNSLKAIAGLQLRLRSKSGRVFLHGEEPSTPSFVLSQGDDGTPYRLLRIV